MQKSLIKSMKRLYTSSYGQAAGLSEVYKKGKEKLVWVRKNHGANAHQDLKFNDCLDGMKHVSALLHENSFVDKKLGVTYKGYSLPEIKEFLARGHDSQGVETAEPLPEALYHLFLTGKFPKQQDMIRLAEEINARQSKNLDSVKTFISNLPKNMHPLTQLSSVALFLQKDSKFAKAYSEGINKNKYWEVCLEDSLDLMSQMPVVTALIYQHCYGNGDIQPPREDLDWASNFMHMIGRPCEGVEVEALRAYLLVMADYGGSVTQHTMALVSSALSDVYLSYSASINALQGPYHNLVCNNFSTLLQNIQDRYGDRPTDEQIMEMCDQLLKQDKKVAGFGHEYITYTDPRLLHLKQFADRSLAENQNLFLAKRCLRIIPMYLQSQTGKDSKATVFAYSSILLQEIGFLNHNSHFLLAALSKSLGCTTQIVGERALGLAIERPGSCDTHYIKNKFEQS